MSISEADIQFFEQVLDVTFESNGNPEVVYSLLETDLDRLTLNFRVWLQEDVIPALPEFTDPQEGYEWGIAVWDLCLLLLDFPLGDRTCNIEIAIAGFTGLSQFLDREVYPEDWGNVQNQLGLAYLDREMGDPGENVESAIAIFQETLEVRTREAFPDDWMATINNLGLAYTQRLEGDASENLEQSIHYYKMGLDSEYSEDNHPFWIFLYSNLGLAYKTRIEGTVAENWELALQAFQAGLNLCDRKIESQKWAEFNYQLGLVYLNREVGDPQFNLQQSALAFDSALQVFTREEYPENWAYIQNDLGDCYSLREDLSFSEKVQKVLNYYHNSLELITPDLNSDLWVYTQKMLGDIYASDRQFERFNNLEKAIEHYQLALQIVTPESDAETWASLQNELGMAYLDRLQGERLQNTELAIKHLQDTLFVYTLEDYPAEWLRSYNNLGFACLNNQENLEQAINYLQSALKECNPENHLDLWLTLQGNLAMAYYQKSQNLDFDQSLLHKIIKSCELALSFCDPETYSQERIILSNLLGLAYVDLRDYTIVSHEDAIELAIEIFEKIQNNCPLETFADRSIFYKIINNLGIAYYKRQKGNRSYNLERSLEYFKQSLEGYSYKESPLDWALIQQNLGLIYTERKQGYQLENVELAITANQAALRVYTLESNALRWIQTQNNLGLAYQSRVMGDEEENLNNAIACYENALQVINPETSLLTWATIQNNLGLLYSSFSLGDPEENLEKAIECYQNVLEIHTCEEFPKEWARGQGNLGMIYLYSSVGDEEENREIAIEYFQAALEVYTREAYADDWAMTQMMLGDAYKDRTLGEIAKNQDKALQCYYAALEIHTRADFPESWAFLQNSLGWLYRDLGEYERAIASFKASLEITTPTTAPSRCLGSARAWGNLAYQAGDWEAAIQAYQIAIAAKEQLRIWENTDERRQALLAKDIAIYDNLVQACVNLGQFDLAFETVERSRSRRLVDLMASNDLYQGGDIPPEVEEYLHQFESLQQQIDGERRNYQQQAKPQQLVGMLANTTSVVLGSQRSDRASLVAYNDTIAELEAQKQAIWQKLRRLDPVLAGEIQVSPPNLAAIRQQIEHSTTAVLSCYTTQDETYIFILKQNSTACHPCHGQGRESLQNWIDAYWLQPYLKDKDQWFAKFEGILAELAQRLGIDTLIEEYLSDIEELLILPHLYLHQIPFAALPILGGKYLGDRFLIRYAPSCQILEFCQQRPSLAQVNYGTVEDATEDLPCASFEGSQIAQLYNIPEAQRLRGRIQATVSNYRTLAKQVQAIVSSHHAQSRLDNPLESKLDLSDGSITLGQLMTPGWRLPDLTDVFLSCCETGLGVTEITDDLLTLASGFLCAGARSVVSTLWAVDDLASALFSIFYHQHRFQGQSRPEALKKAQNDLRGLTGQALASQYKAHLNEILEQKFEQAECDRAQLEIRLDVLPPNHPEYAECEQQEQQLAHLAQSIYDRIAGLDTFCSQDFPFSHPYYWAAFACAGLR